MEVWRFSICLTLAFFTDGVVWIGQGSADELRRVEEAIDRYAPKMFMSRSATCSRGGVLVYVEGLSERVMALGRKYSPAELEAIVYGAACWKRLAPQLGW